MATQIGIGAKAPNFKLPADGGKSIELASLKGKQVVLYFYPKDDTSGCTLQAKNFNDKLAEFARSNTEVIGISADSVNSHDKFKKKYDLAFPLVSDEDKTALEAYGVWVEKSMYGKKYMGIERTTVLIDKDGIVKAIWPKVKVPGHVEEVLAAARG